MQKLLKSGSEIWKEVFSPCRKTPCVWLVGSEGFWLNLLPKGEISLCPDVWLALC